MKDTKERFLAKVEIKANGCWIWAGSIGQNGYGRMRFGGKTHRAHRVAYELYHGPVPRALGVLHSCDCPSCVNPFHLRAGTQKDNVQDAKERGRRPIMKGTSNPSNKLTERQVLEIYNDPEKVKRGFVFRTAKKLKINRNVIYSILCGHRWSHITGHTLPRK